MPQYHFVQTVTYYLTVEADTESAADEIAAMTDVSAAGVMATYEGWQEDGLTL